MSRWNSPLVVSRSSTVWTPTMSSGFRSRGETGLEYKNAAESVMDDDRSAATRCNIRRYTSAEFIIFALKCRASCYRNELQFRNKYKEYCACAIITLVLVPSTRRSSLGDRAFPVAAARAYNHHDPASTLKITSFFSVAPAVIMFSHSGKPTGIVITTAHYLKLQLDGKLHEMWSVDSQQNH